MPEPLIQPGLAPDAVAWAFARPDGTILIGAGKGAVGYPIVGDTVQVLEKAVMATAALHPFGEPPEISFVVPGATDTGTTDAWEAAIVAYRAVLLRAVKAALAQEPSPIMAAYDAVRRGLPAAITKDPDA